MSLLTSVFRRISSIKYPIQVIARNSTNFIHVSTRNISCKTKLCVKMFMEHENKYAYDIMRNRGIAVDIETIREYSPLTKEQFENLVAQDWSMKSPAEIFEVFPKLGLYCKEHELCISNSIFDNYIDNLTDNLKNASDNELVSLFYAFVVWPVTPSVRTRNFIEVWVALDDACLTRLNRFNFDEIHLFVSLFYMLNVSKLSDFVRKSLDKLASRAKKLTPEQLVKTLFFVGVQRHQPFDMHNLEVEMEKHFSTFSVDDLAIMSMGFFKSKTPIRRISLVMKIMELVIENSKDIHEVSLAALLKIIRYSMKIPTDEAMSITYRLLDTLHHETSRLSVMCNVHLALLGSTSLIRHEACLESIANAIIKDMSQTRSKDLERLVLAYGTLRYKPKTAEKFFDMIMDELRDPRREAEITRHGRSFACCVQYLGLLGIYPVDLMNRVLNPEFLETTYGKQTHSYGREVLTVNNNAEIFCSDQQMNRLTEKQCRIMAKKYTDYVPSEDFVKQYNITEKLVIDIIKKLRNIRGGKDFVVGDHILTHYQRGDIILCNSPEGTPLPVTEHFTSKTFGLLRRPPDNNKWIALVVAGRNYSLISGTETPTGQFHVKLEELRRLGYHANLVLWTIYSKLDTMEEKEDYLTKCINDALRNIKY